MDRIIFDEFDSFLLTDKEKEFYNQVWELSIPDIKIEVKIPFLFIPQKTD